MADVQLPVARIEQQIEIDVPAATVWAVLSDPNLIVRYAGGIEGAEVLKMPEEGIEGAELELVTKNSNILRATVIDAKVNERIVVRDERGITSTWTITPNGGDGKIVLRNVIEGPLAPERALKTQYDCDVKFQVLQRILEQHAAGETVE